MSSACHLLLAKNQLDRYLKDRRIGMILEAQSTRLTDILGPTACFRVPIYQRGYDWGSLQCRQIYDDIVRIGAKDDAMHFLGAITYVDEGGFVHEYQLIDGQQRLTTIMLLLCALKKHIVDGSSVSKEQVDHLLFNTGYNGDEHYKLVLTDDDKSFRAVLDGDISEDQNNITSNLRYFTKRLSEDKNACDVVWRGINKLNVVRVMIDKHSDAQAIFESMNSTGLSLTPTDMIKNFILMPHNKSKQQKIYKNHWMPMEKSLGEHLQEFLRVYLMMSIHKNVCKKTCMYNEFKSWMKDRDKETEAETMHEYSKHYGILVGVERHGSQDIDKVIGYIREQDTNVADTLLLKILHDLSHEVIKTRDALELFKLVDSYVLRCHVCDVGKDSNKMFPELISKIKVQDYVKSIESTLMAKTVNRRFPRDTTFKDNIKRFQLYRDRHICKYILSRIEFSDGKERSEDLSIEHIMPQKLNADWKESLGPDSTNVHEKHVHTMGNLTLTAYNSELGDKAFSAKRPIYEESHIGITRKLARYEEWNAGSIEKRAEEMAEQAVKTWPCPQGYDDTNYEIEHPDTDLEEEHLEGKGVVQLWHQFKDKVLNTCETQFQMNRTYGTFRMVEHKNAVLCSIQALQNKIYVTYNTSASDGVIAPSDLATYLSTRHRGRGDYRFTLISDDEIDAAINLTKKVYNHKVSSGLQ